MNQKLDQKRTIQMDVETVRALEERRAALQAETGVRLSLSALMFATIRAAVVQRQEQQATTA